MGPWESSSLHLVRAMLASSPKREVLKSMVIPVFGFAELIQEEYDCLET